MDKITYFVRSRALIDVYRDLNAGILILSPHFQRKLVWRDIHKVDFIKTILMGFPFPEIFIARGDIDVNKMIATSCVVDGQQRMNTIKGFINDDFAVDGKKFSEFSQGDRESFLKYEIAVIELDIDRNDPKVIEIFQRLNRTFYALSQVEKISTEYASSNFMLVAKLLSGEFVLPKDETGEDDIDTTITNIDPSFSENDPNITPSFVSWANQQSLKPIHSLILDRGVFSSYEVSRQVHLMYVLNLMATFTNGFYNRNEKIPECLEEYAEMFEQKETLVKRLNKAAEIMLSLKLSEKSLWFSKSNSFSLMVSLDKYLEEESKLDKQKLAAELNSFASGMPSDYALAAKEAVNNKKERILRDGFIQVMIQNSLIA